MGSSKKADQTTQVDSRKVLGEGAINAEGGSTVNVLDNGAISQAFDFSKAVGATALEFAKVSQGQVADAYAEAKGRGVMTDWILIGAVAMAGLVALQAVKK